MSGSSDPSGSSGPSDDAKLPDPVRAVLAAVEALTDDETLALTLLIVRPVFEEARRDNELAYLVGKILDADAAFVVTTIGPEFRSSAGRRPERVSTPMAAFLDDLDAAITAVVARHKMGRHAPARRVSGAHDVPRRHRRR